MSVATKDDAIGPQKKSTKQRVRVLSQAEKELPTGDQQVFSSLRLKLPSQGKQRQIRMS